MPLSFKVNDQYVELSDDEVSTSRVLCLKEGQRYLALIKTDESVRRLAESFWNHAPDYFFVIPASSTGKYHASWATDIGGLFRHVVMGMYCASELSTTFGLTALEADCAVAAMAGHDCLKYGIEYDVRYTDLHNFLPRIYYGNYKLGHNISKLVLPAKWDAIMGAIERHMGPLAAEAQTWRTVAPGKNRIGPESNLEYVVHLADYMASRKNLTMTDFLPAE
jgi:hypothetical protein